MGGHYVKMRDVGDIIWEGDNPPSPIGDYKLWYSTDTLELYFHYCDAAGTCAWVPTSAPITMLEDLDEGLFEVRQLLNQVNSAAITNENDITLIRESLGKVNLQEVLDNGNTADKGAEFGGTVKVKANNTTADGDSLFTIEGDQANDGTGDNLLVARRHSSQGDQVRYYGPVINGKEVTTKEYVDTATSALDLEQVLTNGNIADKDIYLTHIASSDADIIDISPEKAKVIIATEGSKIPTFELQHYAVDDPSEVKLELDQDGTRFDIECDDKVNNIHFRFEDDVKFELNKDGDASFTGGLNVAGRVSSNGIANQGNVNFKFGSGQGVVLDSGSTFEPMLELKSYSGPGERKEVFSVNARGDANLLGKLTVAPGETDNEAVTYGQLATVAEEIEQIVPAYERGKYNFSLTDVSTGSSDRGKYTLLRLNTASDNSAATKACEDARDACKRNPDNDPIDCDLEFSSCVARLPSPGTVDIVTNSFNSVQKIKFSKYDANGAKHEWTDVAVGQIIDIFNDGDDNYFVGEVTAIDNSNASLVLLTVNKIQAKGNAVGVARIKVFTLNNEIDELTNYVRKTGDQMTGTLETTGRILIRPDDTGAQGGNNMLVVNQQSSKGSASIARFQQDGDDVIKVQYDKTTSFRNNRITEVGNPTDGKDAVNMEWVQNYIAGNVRRLWKWTGDQSSSPGAGKFSFAQSGAGYLYFDHRPTVGTELFNDANQYIGKGGDSLDQDKEFGYATFSIWEWTGTQWLPCKNGHISSTGIRTGKNNEPWRFSSNKNTIINHRNLTKDGLYTICVSGTILS